MHDFLLFYAPLLIVVLAMAASLFTVAKSTKFED
ncbi:cytochrome bd oxidase small subunit CydS [Halalkalibacter krulwichiae]|uniref:Uncharacterized protein n=1 Tax=Halalkalibacter krulwichiae TaxID=199441 RepID=A0A1X9M652_9BACI|nr:hypothetical protein BkAM31D_03095 [Halalkalibacter krulwichiae]